MKVFKKKLVTFYKKIIQNIFKLIYGNVEDVLNPNNNKDILIINVHIEKNKYKIFSCKKSRLYTDTIHDTAILKDNKIIDGPSFQYRKSTPQDVSLSNAKVNLNSVIEKGTPRFIKSFNGVVVSLLTGGGGNNNYWHWLFDVIPRIHILEKANIFENNINFYLFPDLMRKFQGETLDMLNIHHKKRLSSRHIRHLEADEIIVTSHPYNLLNNPYVDSLQIPFWIVDYLKNKFLKNCLKETSLTSFPKKIFINRKDGHSARYLINNSEVEKNLKKFKFSSLTMSDFSFSDQVALFHNADQIVGLHGAAFANTIFCKPKTKVVEMRPDTAGDVIKNLVLSNNLVYFDITSKPKTINFSNQQGDIEINMDLLNQIINT
tara:strand:- start:544 stop:1668 length:1125 start_codon:yes stop_codon:yes gene_type:complete